jgi:hypothetical protein
MPCGPTLADLVEPLLENARDRVKPRLDAVQKHLGDNNAGLPVKLDTLANLLLELLPVAFGEALSPLPNVDRSAVIGRAVTVIRGMVDLLLAAHTGTVNHGLNPRSRHFQTAFLDFFGLVYAAIAAEGVPEKQLYGVFERLASDLAGWEVKLEAVLRGVPDRDLVRVSNPFLRGSGSAN